MSVDFIQRFQRILNSLRFSFEWVYENARIPYQPIIIDMYKPQGAYIQDVRGERIIPTKDVSYKY